MEIGRKIDGTIKHIEDSSSEEQYFCVSCGEELVRVYTGKKAYFRHKPCVTHDCSEKYKGVYENYISLDPTIHIEKTEETDTYDELAEEIAKRKEAVSEVADLDVFNFDSIIEEPVQNQYNGTMSEIREKTKKVHEDIEYSDKQKVAMDLFYEFIEEGCRRESLIINGVAGSGKSLILTKMTKICDILRIKYTTVTFTGKASDVLIKRGINSKTIHSLMYTPHTDEETGEIKGWIKADYLDYKILFIDEFGMLSKEIINDLLSYKIPLVMLGDLSQLPPIGDPSTYHEGKIDVFLDKPLRQSENNPIIKYANIVREGGKLSHGIRDKNEQGSFITLSGYKDKDLIEKVKGKVSLIVCGKNDTRRKTNKEYRKIKGKVGYLEVGENIMCLRNNKTYGVFNGGTFIVERLIRKPYEDEYGFLCQDLKTECGLFLKCCINELLDDKFDFQKEIQSRMTWRDKEYVEPVFITYSYCATVWKMQGSASDNIMVYADDFKFLKFINKDGNGEEDYRRATYTAITRGIKNCVVIL